TCNTNYTNATAVASNLHSQLAICNASFVNATIVASNCSSQLTTCIVNLTLCYATLTNYTSNATDCPRNLTACLKNLTICRSPCGKAGGGATSFRAQTVDLNDSRNLTDSHEAMFSGLNGSPALNWAALNEINPFVLFSGNCVSFSSFLRLLNFRLVTFNCNQAQYFVCKIPSICG
ncbi:hypothetical protein B566_EDAN017551, partial [Ephemera danica]